MKTLRLLSLKECFAWILNFTFSTSSLLTMQSLQIFRYALKKCFVFFWLCDCPRLNPENKGVHQHVKTTFQFHIFFWLSHLFSLEHVQKPTNSSYLWNLLGFISFVLLKVSHRKVNKMQTDWNKWSIGKFFLWVFPFSTLIHNSIVKNTDKTKRWQLLLNFK